MWTAKIVSVTKLAGRITIRIEYSNGTEKFEEELYATVGVDLAWLQGQVRTRVAAFNAAYTFADTLAPNQVIDQTPPTVTPPTQAEQDLADWVKLYYRWVKVKTTLIDTGILTGNETAVTNLKTQVQTRFKPAYVNSI